MLNHLSRESTETPNIQHGHRTLGVKATVSKFVRASSVYHEPATRLSRRMSPVLIIKYGLVRPQGIWPAGVCHHLAINKQLRDILRYHRFVGTGLPRSRLLFGRPQWYRAI